MVSHPTIIKPENNIQQTVNRAAALCGSPAADVMGLSTTEAINLFYRQVKLRNGLPFNVVIPNKTTEKVFKDTDANRNMIRCEDADDMFDKFGI